MTADASPTLAHHMRRMTGRDPDESERASTPLELLFDLTFVVAVGQAANLFAHLVAEGHLGSGLIAFTFATFAVTWAWINFSWFASAFDTDDWVFRVVTMVQMVGVCIVALGLPNLFHSIDEGGHVDNRIVVIGYVVMRLAMVFNWLRAARQAPELRQTCVTYAWAIGIAQAGWIVVAVVDMALWPTLAAVLVLELIEFLGPWLAEHRGPATPWNAEHIAERYSLFAIIALGEGVVGTVAALSSAQDASGGSIGLDVVLVGAAGIGLTFRMWWTYFLLPSGQVLRGRRYLGFPWGYGNMALFGAIIATGAGLHVAALTLEGDAHIGVVGTVLPVAAPVGLYLASVFALYRLLLGRGDAFHVWLLLVTLAVLGCAVWLAGVGVSMPVCLVVVALAPVVTVVGYETVGHRHTGEFLDAIAAE
ncbi:MAG: low temperature requirement protein A [Actinomycetota bacterium]|nr:low temperature requirement protein A [Actinomycetota bacterium]